MTPSLPRVTRTGAAAFPYPADDADDDDDDAPLPAGLGAAGAFLGALLLRFGAGLAGRARRSL